jgi:hypothetical protein
MGETVDEYSQVEYSQVCSYHFASSFLAIVVLCSGSSAGDSEADGDH